MGRGRELVPPGKVATIAVTIVAGPLNYLGMNPKIACQTPQPSK
ncbi:hypothetical protein [Nonomuraea jabiensis]